MSQATESPGVIQAGCAYTAPAFKRELGIGRSVFNQMRQKGLRVVRFGGRIYVLGEDFLVWLREKECDGG